MSKLVKFITETVRTISRETAALAWTLGGTALVLITLSGDTQMTAIQITIGAALLHFAGVLIPSKSTNDEPDDQGKE